MTSPTKAEANRRNAQQGTGPRSAAGKARVSRNAYQHGLSLPISADQSAAEIAELIQALELDAVADPELVSLAAESHLEMLRVRRLKADLLNREAQRVKTKSRPIGECVALAFVRKVEKLEAFDRYEQRALSRRRRALRKLSAHEASHAPREKERAAHSRGSHRKTPASR
jgi:hypothetical protein